MSGEDKTPQDVDARRAALRAARARAIEPRDGDEPVGVMAHPEPAGRNEAPRDSYRGDVPDEMKFTRRGRNDRMSGQFDVPERYKKPGWSYQFITVSVLNQPETSTVRTMEYDGGWRASKARDFGDLVGSGTSPDSDVVIDGQRLYERPARLTRQAQEEDLQAAQEQMRDRVAAAAAGESAHRGHEGLPNTRGIRKVPISIEISGESG